MFRNVYAYRNTYVHVITVSELKKKAMNLKERWEKYMGCSGVRNRKGEMLWLSYHLKTNNSSKENQTLELRNKNWK